MDHSPVLQLDRHSFIVQLHQKPTRSNNTPKSKQNNNTNQLRRSRMESNLNKNRNITGRASSLGATKKRSATKLQELVKPSKPFLASGHGSDFYFWIHLLNHVITLKRHSWAVKHGPLFRIIDTRADRKLTSDD